MAFHRRARGQIGIGGGIGGLAIAGVIASALVMGACAGIEFLPGAGDPPGGGSHAPPAPPPPPDPPAPARATIALDAITLNASPLLVRTAASEPDVQAIVKPLLSAAIMKQWRAYDDLGGAAIRHHHEALRAKSERDEVLRSQEQIAAWPASVEAAIASVDEKGTVDGASTGDAPALSARGAKARAELVAALGKVSTTGKEDASAAAMVALASIEEEGGTSDPKGGVDRAIALHRQVIAKKGSDTAIGWTARYRLAALAPIEAGALYDALAATPPNDATRAWTTLLARKPVHDWAKAATAFRALADAPKDEREKRAARMAWMGAAFDAGDPKQALDAASAILRDAGGALPEEAIVVARDAIAALGGVDRVQIALNPPELMTVALEVARAAAERFDSNETERAVKLVLERGKAGTVEAPVAASILAGAIARRGDTARAEKILENARVAYAVRGPWWESRKASLKAMDEMEPVIDAAVRTLDRPLPHAAQTDAEKTDEMRVRLRTLAQTCLARASAVAANEADKSEKKATTFEITATTYPDRAAEVLARATVGEAPPGGLACVADRGPSFFEYAPASVKGTVVVAR